MVARLRHILENRDEQMRILKEELAEIKEKFGDERRTEIVYAAEEFDLEDLIQEEDMVVTISRTGYIKRMSPRAYRVQNRGGRGVTGMKTKEEDFVEKLFVASTHAYLMFLTSKGICYWLKVYKIPEGERAARGRPLVNLLQLDPDEKITAVVPVQEFSEDKYLFTATRQGAEIVYIYLGQHFGDKAPQPAQETAAAGDDPFLVFERIGHGPGSNDRCCRP